MLIDNWPVPNNPAVLKAKDIYKNLVQDRYKIEKEIKYKRWPEYLQCTRCLRHGITKKYPSKTMLHIYGISKRKTGKKLGKKGINWRHYCPECQKKYKPHIF